MTAQLVVKGQGIAFALGVVLIPAGLAGQLLLAGVAIFQDGSHWETHAMFGGLAGIPILLMAGMAISRRLPPDIRMPATVQAVLYILQVVLVVAGENLSIGWIGALHPVNAMGMVMVSTVVAQRLLRR